MVHRSAVRPPALAAAFGYAGLLPPTAAAVALVTLPDGVTRQLIWVLLVFYAALIFSFLGGTWWSFSATDVQPGRLALAIAPSLIALTILLLMLLPAVRQAATVALAVAIGASPLGDRALARDALTPSWWMTLRLPLSIGLALCVAIAAWRVPAL